MKRNLKRHLFLLSMCMIGFLPILHAQSMYTINDSKDINMKLSGTSTLHDWAMNTKIVSGTAQFGFKQGSTTQLTTLKELNFSMLVSDLKSKEKGLDKNAYKALKTDKFKNIVYKLTSATVSPEKDKSFLIKTHGDLSVAGVTKDVAMDVHCVINQDETITCTGSDNLKMSDYQVKPPSFMLGAMKTGNDITLDFTMVYKK